MSEVKHTFLKSFRGKKLEGEHGVWFGGEWEEREWFVWLISLIWQDKGIKEAVLGKMWANPWEALPSGVWSTGEPRSTARDKGVGERCQLRIWADCPRTAPQKLPETGFSKKFIVCVFTLSECYNIIYREVVLLKSVQEISLMWSTGEPWSPAFDKVLAKHCGLRIWADCSRTAP